VSELLEETFTQALVNYGALGMVTAVLLVEKFKQQTELKEVVKNNTYALAQNTQVLQYIHEQLKR